METWRVVIIGEDGAGGWRVEGQLDGPVSCPAVRDALRAGRLNPAPPQRWHDIEAGGALLRFNARPETAPGCP